MITLTAQINLISGGDLRIIMQPIGNNMSSSIPLGFKKAVKNPFIIGSSRLGDGSEFSGGVDYFIGSQLANKNGFFDEPYKILVRGNEVSYITIAFDDNNGRHPNSITIDGVPYYDDDAIFSVQLPTVGAHTIEIDNWNTPNYPLVISGIYSGAKIDINKRNLISLSFGSVKKEANGLPNYGVISSSSGSLTIKDTDGEIYDFASQKLLGDNLSCEIFLSDTISGSKSTIAKKIASKWNYDIQEKVASCKLIDDIERMQNIDFSVPHLGYTDATLGMLFEVIKTKAEDVGFEIYISEQAQAILNNTISPYAHIKKGSLWYAFQKLCEACGLYMYMYCGVVKIVAEGEFNP